jgi:hypothetical protein
MASTHSTARISVRRKRRFVRETPDHFQVTDRDVQLVRLVAEHRFLRSTHLSDLCQAPHKKVCVRLARLFHAGYLDRPPAQFERYRDGGGSDALVYALGNRGVRLLAEQGVDAADVDWKRKNDAAGRQFILHTLAISDVRVALQRAIQQRPGLELLSDSVLLQRAPEETQRRERPWLLRPRVHYRDAAREVSVEPDHVFAIGYPERHFRAFLVECDRGTMPVDRANLLQSSLKRKILAYAAARLQVLHERQLGWKAFRVLVVTTNPQRVETILATIRACTHEHDRALFLVADRMSLSGGDILSHPWRDARGQTHTLI